MKKIVWALDAFEQNSELQNQAAQLVARLRKRWNATVQPVHVLGPAELSLSAEFAGPWVGQYRHSAERALLRLVDGLGIEGLEPPTVVTHPAASTTGTVQALIEFAQHQYNADAIIVGTHGRSGVSRLLLGSFAETLLLKSPLPVLVAGAHMSSDLDWERMLFPTEFETDAKDAFRKASSIAADLGVRNMTIYHAVPRPIESVYQSGVFMSGGPWIPVMEYYQYEVDRHRRHAEGWANWATQHGVATEAVIDTESHNVAEAILALARKQRVGWITLAAHSGAVASALLGSVTRKVVRAAECPVWVLRHEALVGAQKPRSESWESKIA